MKLIKAELKDLYSPDIPDLKNPGIREGTAFCVPLEVDFGPRGEEGQDQFDMLVCNPQWITQRTSAGIFSGLHYLIMLEFDILQIRSFLQELAEQCVGANWDEVAAKLSKFGRWEFDNYSGGAWTVN